MKPEILVKIIGWSWTIIGFFSLILGCSEFFKLISKDAFSEFSLFINFSFIAFDVVAIYSAQQFLRKVAWSRVVLQFISIAYCVGSMINAFYSIKKIIANPELPGFASCFGIIGVLLVSIFWIFLFLFVVYLLNLKSIKNFVATNH